MKDENERREKYSVRRTVRKKTEKTEDQKSIENERKRKNEKSLV